MSTKYLHTHWDQIDRERLIEEQMSALREYLTDIVIPFSEYYRNLFAENEIVIAELLAPEHLSRIPFTTKADLLSTPEHPDRARDFVIVPDEATLRRRPSTILKAMTQGKEAAQEALEREFRPVMMTATTGRSSDPVPFLYTHHDIANLETTGARLMDICDSRKDYRHLNVFPFAPHLAFWQMHYAGLAFNTFSLSTGGGKGVGTEGNVAMIRKLKPDAIIGMPTFIYHLFNAVVEEGFHWPNLHRIVLGGEKAPRGLREKLRALAEKFGSTDLRIMSTYGFTEAKAAWPECAFGKPGEPTGFHTFPDMGIVEIIDPDTLEPVGDGEPGEIVFTPLNARGTVVLRYRTGDLIEGGMVYEPCPGCGRKVPRLVGRISRVSNMKEMRLGKLKGTLIDFNELEHILDDEPRAGQWQIELRKANNDPHDVDELVVHVELIGSGSKDELESEIGRRFVTTAEIRPNRIVFHDAAGMRKLQGVGKELKETRLIDHRPKADAPPDSREKAKPELEPVR